MVLNAREVEDLLIGSKILNYNEKIVTFESKNENTISIIPENEFGKHCLLIKNIISDDYIAIYYYKHTEEIQEVLSSCQIIEFNDYLIGAIGSKILNYNEKIKEN